MSDPMTLSEALSRLDPAELLRFLRTKPAKVAVVPPDPRRRFVSKSQYKQVFLHGTQTDGHGFAYVDPKVEAASHGAAGYYAWNPVPGMRFIALDTLSEGGIAGPSADGNVDDPQFKWLRGQLQAATAADELVVIFSHHAIPSLTSSIPDEAAPPCTVNDRHGHDLNPGCDVDPRDSRPIHLGDDLEALLHRYPHVIAWVAGHSHVNDVTPYPDPDGSGGFWSIRVAAEADWPQQSRLLQVFDNEDGTLSIFGTILDHASDATAPAGGTSASSFDPSELASVARTLSYNDNQKGARECNPACGEGEPEDRNVELLLPDPRTGSGGVARRCVNRVVGTPQADTMNGTPGPDRLLGRAGDDRVATMAGRDCLHGNRGRDRLRGGSGRDTLVGGRGGDWLRAADGAADVVRCGPGADVAVVDALDETRDCERVDHR